MPVECLPFITFARDHAGLAAVSAKLRIADSSLRMAIVAREREHWGVCPVETAMPRQDTQNTGHPMGAVFMKQGSMELQGKVALVTGAGSGIGKVAAILLAREGATVGALSHTEDEIRQTVQEIEDSGGKAVPLIADVADAAAVERAVGELVGQCGHLDIIFANAGINGVWAPIDEIQPDEWDRTINTNL